MSDWAQFCASNAEAGKKSGNAGDRKMSGPFIATFDKRVRDALKILPPGFDREEVEKSVAALLYREARHLRRPSFTYRPPISERERKAIKRVANATPQVQSPRF
jgi:hypothetical protein